MQSLFDCRKAVNSIQFLSSIPQLPTLGYSSYLHWPFCQHSQLPSDGAMDYFGYSNYLPFFCKNHPARIITPYTVPTLAIHSLSPTIISTEGATVQLKGKHLSRVHSILLVGCEEGSRSILFDRQNDCLLLQIPALLRGLYTFQFYTQDGMRLVQSAYQPWFGVCSLLVSELMYGLFFGFDWGLLPRSIQKMSSKKRPNGKRAKHPWFFSPIYLLKMICLQTNLPPLRLRKSRLFLEIKKIKEIKRIKRRWQLHWRTWQIRMSIWSVQPSSRRVLQTMFFFWNSVMHRNEMTRTLFAVHTIIQYSFLKVL